MTPEELRRWQAPLKEQYREDPLSARVAVQAAGILDPERLQCRVESSQASLPAGLHPAAGGERGSACSGDMLLESLVACAGVTALVVATAMGLTIRSGRVRAEGVIDFRGTLGVDRETPVGISEIALTFELDSDADPTQRDKLLQLTERYCVILRTLQQPPKLVCRCG
jgi:uncharacterized OsmC-like protein